MYLFLNDVGSHCKNLYNRLKMNGLLYFKKIISFSFDMATGNNKKCYVTDNVTVHYINKYLLFKRA